MYLTRLRLQNFRNWEEGEFHFSPKLNAIIGDNAQGKTSILEAIHLLLTGRSFRTVHLSDLIRKGASAFSVEAHFVKHGVEQRLQFSFDGKEKRIWHNRTLCPSILNLLGLLQGVVLTPEDVHLVKGAPQKRRAFLDMLLAKADPLYVHHLMRYHRALQQRNQLLKAKTVATISCWEQEMAQAASYIVSSRRSAIHDLSERSSKVYSWLSGAKNQLDLSYQTTEGDFLKIWERQRGKEMMLGCTLAGPHREDFSLALDEKDARTFASEGEQRSCTMALRLGEWERLQQLAEMSPVMVVDDVGIGLDALRCNRLLDRLHTMGQVFVSTAEESLFPRLERESTLFRIQEGKLQ